MQLWCVEYDIVGKNYIQAVELRGIDAGHEVLQIFGNSLEPKMCENREDRAYRGRGTAACLVRTRPRGSESKHKLFEGDQGGEDSDHPIG